MNKYYEDVPQGLIFCGTYVGGPKDGESIWLHPLSNSIKQDAPGGCYKSCGQLWIWYPNEVAKDSL